MSQSTPPKEELIDAENLQKLRLLVQSLKKKYGEAVGQSYSLDAKCRELSNENTLLKQTQSAISQKFNETLVELHSLQEEREKILQAHTFSSTKADDSNIEVKALREQHAELLSSVKRSEEEAKKATDELQAVKLKETQLERVIQFLRKRSEEAHLETNQISQELIQAQEQAQNLAEDLKKSKSEVDFLKSEVKSLSTSNISEREELKALQEQLQVLSLAFQEKSKKADFLDLECIKLKEGLHDENTRFDTLSKEHIFLKQSMMRSVEEVKKELVKAETSHKEALQIAFESYLTKEKELLSEIDTLKIELENYKHKEKETLEILAMKSSIEEERRSYLNQVRELKEQVSSHKADRDEVEQRFKTAQQHLAKKVRETALATERVEVEKVRALDLQNQLNVAQIKITELKNSLDMEAEHQKRALARESELLKNAEAQVARLEEKVFNMHEKWKEAETEARELKKIEEKWREAEKLFSQMGHFGSTLTSDAPRVKSSSDTPRSTIPSPAATFAIEPAKIEVSSQNPSFEQPTFFEEKKQTPRFKESFL